MIPIYIQQQIALKAFSQDSKLILEDIEVFLNHIKNLIFDGTASLKTATLFDLYAHSERSEESQD